MPAAFPLDSQWPALVVVVLCFLVTVICAIDRAAMSVAIIPMSAEFGYTDSTKGLVASAYFWGYTVSNLFCGILCTLVSPKLVLALGAAFWSLFTVLTPVAAAASLPALLGCRALMGVAEGACLPTIQQLLSNWIPVAERSRALALVSTGITAGTLAALYVAPQVVASFGWQSVFVIFGLMGFVWCALWAPLGADAPESKEACIPYACEVTWDTAAEVQESWQTLPWQQLLSSSAFRGVVVCGMAHNCGGLLLLSWLPTYFADSFGLGVSEASMLAAPPWLACFAVGNAGGWAADALVAPLRDVRRGFQLLGSLGPAVCLLLLSAGPATQQEAALLFTGALGMSGCSYVGYNAAPQDMARRYTSVVFGLMNATGCLAGSLAVWLAGVALEGGSPGSGFSSIFLAAAGAYVVGAAAFFTTYCGEREFD